MLLAVAPTIAHGDGVLFVDNYPEDNGIQVRSFKSITKDSGKIRLTDRNGHSETINERFVPGIIAFFDEAEFPHITDEASLEPIVRKRSEIEFLGTKLEEAKPYARKAVIAFDAVIARVRSGDRKVNGKWITADDYQRQEAVRQTSREQKIAQERAAEQERFTTERTTEEKRLQELKAAQQAIEKEFTTAQSRIRTDAESAQRGFTLSHQQLSEKMGSTAKGVLSGHVFVRTEEADNIRLGDIKLRLYAREPTDLLIQTYDRLRENFSEDRQRIQTQLNQVRDALNREHADIGDRLSAIRQAFEIDRATYSEMLHVYGTKLDGISQDLDRTVQEADDMSSYLHSADFYFSAFKKSLATAESDPDGRFAMEMPKQGSFVIAAQAQRKTDPKERFIIASSRTKSRESVSQASIATHTRSMSDEVIGRGYGIGTNHSVEQENIVVVGQRERVFGKKEQYYWLEPVSLDGAKERSQNLSNNNLTSTEDTSSLIRTADMSNKARE